MAPRALARTPVFFLGGAMQATALSLGGLWAIWGFTGARPAGSCLLSLGGSSKVGIKRGVSCGFGSDIMHVGLASRRRLP